MKLSNSPFTREFLARSYANFNQTGLFWGSLELLTGCYTITNDRFLFMKFGFSGSGKTISDKIAMFWAERLNPIVVSSRITPAGLAKLYRKAKSDQEFVEQFAKFYDTKLILLEDLSKGTTKYLRTTTISFLAGLTKNNSLDDLTSEGGGLDIKLSELPKKCMLSGTPSQYEELTASDIFTEHVDRRSITITSLLNDDEWNLRKQLAFNGVTFTDEELIEYWKNIIRESYDAAHCSFAPDEKVATCNSSLYRKIVFEKLIRVKGFPENLMFMIDSLAKGHALINGRRRILEEDYEVLDKIFSRFLYLSDMKKKEYLIVEEVLRNRGAYGVNIDDLVYLLRIRSKRENIPEAEEVRKTIEKYIECSKYLSSGSVVPALAQPNIHTSGNPAKSRIFVDISDYLKNIFNTWNAEIKEIIQ